MRRATLFPGRAEALWQAYRGHRCLADLAEPTRRELAGCFGRPLEEVWQRLQADRSKPVESVTPRQQLALVCRSYFARATELALAGDPAGRADYQIPCSPAMGAFKQFVAGSSLSDWRQCDVAVITELLMDGAAEVLSERR